MGNIRRWMVLGLVGAMTAPALGDINIISLERRVHASTDGDFQAIMSNDTGLFEDDVTAVNPNIASGFASQTSMVDPLSIHFQGQAYGDASNGYSGGGQSKIAIHFSLDFDHLVTVSATGTGDYQPKMFMEQLYTVNRIIDEESISTFDDSFVLGAGEYYFLASTHAAHDFWGIDTSTSLSFDMEFTALPAPSTGVIFSVAMMARRRRRR
ncbi:MAG: hypothetical protein AAF432_11290 [Planctomycetota bacterium]